MAEPLTYTELAEKASISRSYAHEIMSGRKSPPLPIALQIFDATGLQFGAITGLSKREIETARKMAKAA